MTELNYNGNGCINVNLPISAITRAGSLRKFTLRGCDLTKEEWICFMEVFLNYTSLLEELDMSKNAVRLFSNRKPAFRRAMNDNVLSIASVRLTCLNLNHLRSLNLSNSKFDDTHLDVHDVNEFLQNTKTLDELTINHCDFGTNQNFKEFMTNGIAKNRSLQCVELSDINAHYLRINNKLIAIKSIIRNISIRTCLGTFIDDDDANMIRDKREKIRNKLYDNIVLFILGTKCTLPEEIQYAIVKCIAFPVQYNSIIVK